MTDIHAIRAQLLEKSKELQKQYNINNQVDKLAEIQDNIEKEEQMRKRKKSVRKLKETPSIESTRRSKRLKGEEADLSNVDATFMETTSKVTNAQIEVKRVKSGVLTVDEIADEKITIENVEYKDENIEMSANDKTISSKMNLQFVGDLQRIMKHRISDMALHPSNLCALGDKEGNVTLWNYENQLNNKQDLVVSNLNIHDNNISHISFIDQSLLTSSYFNMRLTDLNTFSSDELVRDIKISAVYTQNSKVYYGSTDGKVHLRDIKSKRASRILVVEEGKKLNTIDIRDNTILISGLHRKVQLYDIRNTSQVVDEFVHGYSVNSAYFNSAGSQIVSTSYDNYLRIFNTQALSSGPFMKRVHDCTTGKWVTKFKAKFDASDSLIYCPDKSRKIMYYSLKNMKMLYASPEFSAIPAVVCTRPNWSWNSNDTIITGNGSGKCQILQGIKSE